MRISDWSSDVCSSDLYYFARGPQLVNRVVDIGKYIDKKVESNVIIKNQGPGGDSGALLRKSLADQGKKLPILEDSDDSANFSYVKNFVLDVDSEYLRGVPSDRRSEENTSEFKSLM